MCKVVVDDREDGGRVGVAVKGFGLEGCSVSVERLSVGDYCFEDLVVWEYKTVPDFVNSLYNGSLFNEVFNQSSLFPFSFLIVEGDFRSFLYKQFYRRGKHKQRNITLKEYIDIQMRNINGAIRRCRTVCNVINCKTQAECLNEMLEQSKKCINFKGYGGVVRPSNEYNSNPCKSPLMEVKGIGDKISDTVISEFELKCLHDFHKICYDDLLNVKGINEEMANAFWQRVYGCSYDDSLKKG